MPIVMKRFFVAALVLFTASSALAESAESLVQNMGKAFREHNYRGYLTYEYGSKIESFAVLHAVVDGRELEKISTQAGAASEIVRSGHALHCLHSGNKLLRYGLNSPANMKESALAGGATAVLASYDFLLMGDSRVAGRDVSEVHVVPRDALRNGFKLSIDKQTGLMLKTVILSPEAKVLERFQFVHVDIGVDIDPSEFESVDTLPVRDVTHGENLKQVLSVNAGVAATPSWLPSGFVLSEEDHHHNASSLMLYSDGLATVSIVLEKVVANTASLATDGRARRGSMVAYTRPVLVDGEKYVLTVMGEVPLFTAARIARQMKFLRAG